MGDKEKDLEYGDHHWGLQETQDKYQPHWVAQAPPQVGDEAPPLLSWLRGLAFLTGILATLDRVSPSEPGAPQVRVHVELGPYTP